MESREIRLLDRMKAAKNRNAATPVAKRRWFRGIADEVREALADGEPALAIWQHLFGEGDCPVTYQTFVRYCNAMQKSETLPSTKALGSPPETAPHDPPSSAQVPTMAAENPAPPPRVRPDSTGRIFVHNPHPKIEDLI